MKLYQFDGVDEALELLPLAARRALDAVGLRLSRAGWQSLPVERRRAVVDVGSAITVDADAVRAAVVSATPPAETTSAVDDPDPSAPPTAVLEALGPERPVSPSTWSALTPLDRYSLAKVCGRGRADRVASAYDEIVGHSGVSSHLGPGGGVRMVDVGQKAITSRHAVAESVVSLGPEAFERLRTRSVPKGDVLGTARIAGILAAKRTPELVPLCHQVALTRVSVDFELLSDDRAVRVLASADARDRTGVEMESLVAASIAALTIYDMLKGVDRGIIIGPTRLLEKSGGRTGEYSR